MSEQTLREALKALLEVQDEKCRWDHNGYCQAHNLDHQLDGCRVEKARAALLSAPVAQPAASEQLLAWANGMAVLANMLNVAGLSGADIATGMQNEMLAATEPKDKP